MIGRVQEAIGNYVADTHVMTAKCDINDVVTGKRRALAGGSANEGTPTMASHCGIQFASGANTARKRREPCQHLARATDVTINPKLQQFAPTCGIEKFLQVQSIGTHELSTCAEFRVPAERRTFNIAAPFKYCD